MPSFFSWLDYSERERRQMLDVISRFRERDTRDELGIGSVRDAFADIFFPGTSTIQTRARYFLFIPWIYLHLETKHASSGNAAQIARNEETKLIYGLLKSGEKQGVIGSDAKEKLQRLPSNIYWHGLGVWGIRIFKGTQPQYHRYLDTHALDRNQSQYNDDNEPIEGYQKNNWHSGLPPKPADFPDLCNFKLSYEEAIYLKEKICMHVRNTLLAFLVENSRSCEYISYPWEHPQYASFPEEIKNELAHARNFSEGIYGAPLLYNLMLAEASNNRELENKYRAKIKKWAADLISSRYDIFIDWMSKIEKFWEIVQRPSVRIPFTTKQFIMQWLNIVLKPGLASRIAENLEARRLIHERECHLKRSLARLDNPRARELWNGAAGDFQIDYRWGIAQRLVNDILEGLRKISNA